MTRRKDGILRSQLIRLSTSSPAEPPKPTPHCLPTRLACKPLASPTSMIAAARVLRFEDEARHQHHHGSCRRWSPTCQPTVHHQRSTPYQDLREAGQTTVRAFPYQARSMYTAIKPTRRRDQCIYSGHRHSAHLPLTKTILHHL